MADRMTTTYNVPSELKEVIELETGYFIGLLPGWVHHLYVDFSHTVSDLGEHTRASVKADYRYRRVYLTIYPGWLIDGGKERRHTFIHEACHVLSAPVHECIRETICEIFKDRSDLAGSFRVNYQIAMEASTEDMANCILEVAHDYETMNVSADPPQPAAPPPETPSAG